MALAGSGGSDAPEWWREGGRPGAWPGATAGSGFPWALGGLALGAWEVVEPIAGPTLLAFPGIASAREPLAWFDSLEVDVGEGAAWRGYDATLAAAAPGPAVVGSGRTRAVFHLLDGDFGVNETGLRIERGDSLRLMRTGALSATGGPRGALGLSGRHLWGTSARLTLGAHRFDAGYEQRGAAASLLSGEQQSMRGEGGRLAWRFRHGGVRAALSATRGRDAGESFLPDRDLDRWSRRDAQRNSIALEAGESREARDLSARLAWSETEVRRSNGPAFDRVARTLWAAARLTRPAGEGALDLQAGAGHHDAFGGWDLAPSAAYRFASGPFRGRVVLERMLTPAWSDLAPGVEPFLQRSWVAGWEVRADSPAALSADLGFLFGASRDRAIVRRLPLEEQWLREGLIRDSGRYDFGLVTAGAAWRNPRLAASVQGFALAREPSPSQPRVDPPFGGRLGLELRVAAFQRELGVTLRAEVEGVGPRESEAAVPRRIEGFTSFGLTGAFTLGEAVLTVRARNLEDRRRTDVWIDPATGREAVGVGREVRIAFAWTLFD